MIEPDKEETRFQSEGDEAAAAIAAFGLCALVLGAAGSLILHFVFGLSLSAATLIGFLLALPISIWAAHFAWVRGIGSALAAMIMMLGGTGW